MAIYTHRKSEKTQNTLVKTGKYIFYWTMYVYNLNAFYSLTVIQLRLVKILDFAGLLVTVYISASLLSDI